MLKVLFYSRSSNVPNMPHLQASFGAFAFMLADLAEQPGCLLGAASVDRQPESSVTVVVYNLNESRVFQNISKDHRSFPVNTYVSVNTPPLWLHHI